MWYNIGQTNLLEWCVCKFELFVDDGWYRKKTKNKKFIEFELPLDLKTVFYKTCCLNVQNLSTISGLYTLFNRLSYFC